MRIPEIFLGAMITIAVFAMGMAVQSSRPAPTQVTQVAAAEGADQHAAEGKKDEREGSYWINKDAAGFFTFLLFVVGILQAGLFVWQLYLIRISLHDAKIAADASADAASASSRQARVAEDTLAKIERPYLFIFNVSRLEVERVHSVDQETILRVSYSVANYGKIPAIIKHAAIGLHVSKEPLAPNPLGMNHDLISGPILAPGETRHRLEETLYWDKNLNEEEPGSFFPDLGDDDLWFWAIVTYRGPFTDQHETRLCMRYEPGSNYFAGPIGGPEFSGEK
jgi:hypothetical protein